MIDSTVALPSAQSARGLTIAHLVGLDDADAPAFAHAVALAHASASSLVSIHANDDPSALARMPRATTLLTRWGLLPADAQRGAAGSPGMQHRCVLDNCCDDVVDTLLNAVAQAKPDLLIATTGASDAVRRVLAGSVAEAVARGVSAPTLLLPGGCRPFVDAQSGALALKRVIVAAGDERAAYVGADHALWLADMAGATELDIELLHVGEATPAPVAPPVRRANTRIHVNQVQGSLEPQVAARAEAWPADLLVMATRGHDSLRDVLLGSHAERTLHLARCPVLSIPLL